MAFLSFILSIASVRRSRHKASMLRRLFPDPFIFILLSVVLAASLFPAKGEALAVAGRVSNVAIFSLFFFHGLRLPRQAVVDGLKHWKLQGAVLVMSFAVLPLLGLVATQLVPDMLTSDIWIGVLFLCVLPTTVQASIASASMAQGNVAAAVIASAVSNLLAVLLTPLLFTLIAHIGGEVGGLDAISRIMTLLLLPFALGQLLRHWLADWAARNRAWIGRLDRLTILITVYVTFSAAVNEGLWHRLDGAEFVRLGLVVLALLAAAFTSAWVLGRLLGLNHADRVTLFFSGAHKSLATGAPMARILFPAAQAGFIILPLMLYHQLQLMLSAWIAGRLARAGRRGA